MVQILVSIAYKALPSIERRHYVTLPCDEQQEAGCYGKCAAKSQSTLNSLKLATTGHARFQWKSIRDQFGPQLAFLSIGYNSRSLSTASIETWHPEIASKPRRGHHAGNGQHRARRSHSHHRTFLDERPRVSW
ncbi:hypothetical protein SAMN05216228_108011 [Rhizobium tibeticum]|uniref:Uncharacterized protein n=1 Tax=Rhizobium tibeticum TaxID=501024 RepID=A0A1H8WVL1_9HYPH|nr:hypothetical protein RTCCBAU85039_6668 [Rhizobium tibeticum]SEP31487.1 hypothetical protein SAMN05216228_108011 [Rhizobium tibeticum]